MVPHDLRSPLGVARGWVEMAQLAGSWEDVSPRIDHAVMSLDRMARMIADLLAQAEFENRPLDLHEVVLDGVDGLVAEVCRELSRDGLVHIQQADLLVVDP